MKKLYLLLSFLMPLTVGAQVLQPFGGTRGTDTAYTPNSLRVDKRVKLPFYSNTDATKFLTIDANGNLVFGIPAGGGGTGAYVPLSGTTTNAKLTGPIEAQIFSQGGLYTNYNGYLGGLKFNVNRPKLYVTDANGNETASAELRAGGITLSSNASNATGISGMEDYTHNIGPLDYPQKKYVDSVVAGISGGGGPVAVSSLTQSGATTGQGIIWTGSVWAPGNIGGGGGGLQRVFDLKAMGVPDGAILTPGSTIGGADGTALIQSALNSNMNGGGIPCRIIWNVHTAVTGLTIYSNTEIDVLPGCGAFLLSHSNKAVIANAHQNFNAATRNDSNIVIRGGIWNANGKGQDFVASPSYGQVSGFRFYGCTGITCRDFTILEMISYAFDAINCQNVLAENFRIDQGPNGSIYNDGIHANFCDNVTYRGGHIKCSDDAVALNTDDQYNNPSGPAYPYYLNAHGPSRNILIEDMGLDSTVQFGFRMLSGGGRMDNIVLRHFYGVTTSYAGIIDNYWQAPGFVVAPGPGNVGNVLIEDFQLTTRLPGGNNVNSCVFNLNCNIENVTFKDARRNSFPVSLPTIYVTGSGTVIRNLTLDGYDSYDSTGLSAIDAVVVDAATVNRMNLTRISIDQKGAPTNSSLLHVRNGGKVDIAMLNNVNCNRINKVINNEGSIKAIVACNVIHTSAGGGSTFATTTTVPSITASNILTDKLIDGTYTQQKGDAFITGNNGGASIVYTGDVAPPPVGSGNSSVGQALRWATRETGVTNTDSVWYTTSNNGGWAGNGAIDNLVLPANSAGRIHMYCSPNFNSGYGSGVIGFKTVGSSFPTGQANFFAGFSLGGSPDIVVYENGNGRGTGYFWVPGKWYGLYRTATGVYTVQESSDGVNWSDIIPLTNVTDPNYITAQNVVAMILFGNQATNKVFYPKGNGLQ